MEKLKVTKEEVFRILEDVKDPEIPVLSIFDMGILRDAIIEEDLLKVIITPTYSGCPAMRVIEEDVVIALSRAGFSKVKVEMTFSPPWTTDWMSEAAKLRMKGIGIAPPVGKSDELFNILKPQKPMECPFCDSKKTTLKSEFAATACKSLYFCNNCNQPFEHFKCH
jgi:ring-1,2-phenylacetyl-CoA epoxidase subunit PaaD